jgi:hypothetical protein
MFRLIQINKIGVSNFVIKYMLSGSPKMDEKTKRKMVVSAKQLSSAEKLVYDVLVNQSAKADELSQIAKLCNLTELQVVVAIQLLMHKKILPTEQLLS